MVFLCATLPYTSIANIWGGKSAVLHTCVRTTQPQGRRGGGGVSVRKHPDPVGDDTVWGCMIPPSGSVNFAELS